MCCSFLWRVSGQSTKKKARFLLVAAAIEPVLEFVPVASQREWRASLKRISVLHCSEFAFHGASSNVHSAEPTRWNFCECSCKWCWCFFVCFFSIKHNIDYSVQKKNVKDLLKFKREKKIWKYLFV